MNMQSQESLLESIEKLYGFKKELIHDVEQCGCWHVRFIVNGIKYYGWIPYAGAEPQLSVEGYTTSYYWHKTPVTEEYYKENIEGKIIRLIHYSDTESGDWEWKDKTFSTPEEAENYIETLETPQFYTYDIFEEREEDYDYETWREVQEQEVAEWWNKLFCELKDVANVWDFIENWEDVKEQIQANTDCQQVKEEFNYNPDEWLEAIYVRVKPYCEKWLAKLERDKEFDYSEYIANFWN